MADCVRPGLCWGVASAWGQLEPSPAWGEALPDGMAAPRGPHGSRKRGGWAPLPHACSLGLGLQISLGLGVRAVMLRTEPQLSFSRGV